ncbi:MAG: carbon starvation protein A [Candidatus Omnitrophota bacterium]
MNSLVIIFPVILMFYLGYRFYSRRIERLIGIDPLRKTPAYEKYDGVDYVPAKHWTVLFGHHFASIAGAAPVVGPIMAVAIWGWGAALLWVILGTIFMGGVHDYCSVMLSVRHGGSSIADVTGVCVSKSAKTVFSVFLWLTLVLIIAVFVRLCAKTFVVQPEIVAPSLGLIPIAVIVGILLYRLKLNQPAVTVIALSVLVVLIITGEYFPIPGGHHAMRVWSIVLLLYAFVASVTPVHILLQPRDYLSAFLLFFGLLFGYAGLILTHHAVSLPFSVFHAPAAAMPLWPMLFVTIACGAISGFHAIVASGTTSKQISSESDARIIGYGGMITEGLLSAMTIIMMVVAFGSVGELSHIVNSGDGPVAAFGKGYGQVTLRILGKYGGVFAVLLLNAFILTTLDTATRLGRYITQELFGIKNRYIATLGVIILSGWLALSGRWTEIWPIFGAANQLIAALTLIVITSWLLGRQKPVLYTLLPAVFMLLTTIGALLMKINEFWVKRDGLLFCITGILLVLALYVFTESLNKSIEVFKSR